jgi:hypothetical protein
VSEADSGVGEDVAVVSQSLPVECHDGEVAYERYLTVSISRLFCLTRIRICDGFLAMDDLWDIFFNNAALL